MRYEFFKTVPLFLKILVFYQNSQSFCENWKIRYSGFNVCSVDVLSIKRVYMGRQILYGWGIPVIPHEAAKFEQFDEIWTLTFQNSPSFLKIPFCIKILKVFVKIQTFTILGFILFDAIRIKRVYISAIYRAQPYILQTYKHI